jgi:hypothetical protein
LEEYPGFKEFRGVAVAETSDIDAASLPTATPEEQIEQVYLSAQAVLRIELLERILQNSPSFFESVIVDLLVAMGYGGSHRNAARQLGRSGDGSTASSTKIVSASTASMSRPSAMRKIVLSVVPMCKPSSEVSLGSVPRKAFSSPPQSLVKTQLTMPAIWRSALS